MKIKKTLTITQREQECLSKFFNTMTNEYDDANFYDILYAIAFKKTGYLHGEEYVDINIVYEEY